MAKALLTGLLLIYVLFSFDQSDACAIGFISQVDIQRVLDSDIGTFDFRDGYTREQCIFPGVNFTGCNGSITAWTIGVRWIAGANRNNFPYLQIWRNAGTDNYELVNSTKLFVPGEPEPGRYVLNDTVDPPLQFKDGDILGVFQPRGGISRFRLHNLPGGTSTPSYHITTGQNVIEPPFDTFVTTNNNVNEENSLPLVSLAIRIDCSPLNNPINGTVSIATDTNGTMAASYSCNEGYELIGNASRDCQPDGQWSGMEPVCEAIDCGRLMPPTNGTVALLATTFEAIAKYRCDEGYVLAGDENRTCLANGTWSSQPPRCEAIDCGRLMPLTNGNIALLATTFEAIAEYNCDEGYVLAGDESRTCLANGTWSSQPPLCKAIDCGRLMPPINGTIALLATTFEAVAEYRCDEGYVLAGDKNRTCLANGTWSSQPPRCEAIDCGRLMPPTNGTIALLATTFEAIAKYRCDEGYVLAGDESRTCLANGTWSSQPPCCEAIDCGRLMPPANGSITLTATTFQSVARYDCDEGYTLEGEETRICQGSGNWSEQEPICSVSETQEPSPQSGKQNITGIAAGAAGGVVGGALLLIGVVLILLLRRRKVNKKYDLPAPEEHSLHNPLYGEIGVQDERYAEVTGLNIIAPQQTNGVHQTDYELQRLSESAEASYIFDNPVYADSGPITFSQDELYESVEAQQSALEWGIFVPTFEERRAFSELNSIEDPYSIYASATGQRKLVANPSVFFDEEDVYWSPASSCNELYAQLAERKYREILRHQIRCAQKLGSGQFGTVDKGVWQSPAGPVEVAVKTLKEGASEQDRVKFLQEAAISGQFHHPNVIKLHGVVTVGEPTMIVLEFMSKGDLRTYLKEQTPCPGDACPPEMPKLCMEFCQQVASGMEYLTRKAFVHRDLAARNVLVSQTRTCKIADFGMARDLEDENYYVSQGAGQIPVKWTAPEALNFRKFSTASDVWSFGAVMYEIWSLGHKPFEGYSNQQTLRLVNEGYRLSPPSGCPKAIYSIMIKCWHPEPSSRPTFTDLQQTLSDTDNLSWSEEDTKAHPQAAVLGAPLDAGKDLYPELQGTYMY